jgi:hypothetical protein
LGQESSPSLKKIRFRVQFPISLSVPREKTANVTNPGSVWTTVN